MAIVRSSAAAMPILNAEESLMEVRRLQIGGGLLKQETAASHVRKWVSIASGAGDGVDRSVVPTSTDLKSIGIGIRRGPRRRQRAKAGR